MLRKSYEIAQNLRSLDVLVFRGLVVYGLFHSLKDCWLLPQFRCQSAFILWTALSFTNFDDPALLNEVVLCVTMKFLNNS